MCAQPINNSNLEDAEPVENNQMDVRIPEEGSTKKPFYYSIWWIMLWSILLWPIGLIMLWGYLTNVQKNKIPRTTNIKDDLEDLYQP